ncbi:hypothetical protein AB0K35_33915 [Micromonospora sp. NPDC053740]|uniref:hypothetical protein n=1 Tax=Micromonospora sp. NPDC053740 TaxID=3155173 RepID=UPI0034365CD6
MTTAARPERRQLQVPPEYAAIHRVVLGTVALLCQLDAGADYAGLVGRWLPGFDPDR